MTAVRHDKYLSSPPYNKLRHGTKLAEFHAGVGQARFTGL